MNRVFLIIIFLFTSSLAYTNDGVFRAEGNHLIPIQETDIKIKREILTIKKNGINYVDVSVYYEFFNPTADKTITVGFEAFAPSGDVDGTPVNGQHPFMRDFTVELNNTILAYKIAYVRDSSSYKNGKIKSLELNNLIKEIDENDPEFYYVYHFTANFKKGINIIKHTYRYELSGSVTDLYSFSYVLTSAKRWANKQIDDFTLILDMGEFENFFINKTFFNSSKDWILQGIGNYTDFISHSDSTAVIDALKVNIQKGSLILEKKNFKLAGDLYIVSPYEYTLEEANWKKLPFSLNQESLIKEPKNEFERKVLKNLPFARRGYIFLNEELNNYFKKMDWYIPNPNYQPIVKYLTDKEKKWIERWQ
jgi:hypothetical protein